jgi:WD40 repeat protein
MRIASIGKDNAIVVGSLTSKETWKSKGTFAAFTPDGRRLAVADGKSIVLHDSMTGKVVERFAGGHDGNVVRIAFSPDGTRMISGGDDTKVRLWDMTTGEKLQETPAFGLYATIVHLTFSPDGTRFAAAAHGPDQPPPDDMTGMFRVIREVRVFNVPKPEAAFANPITFTPQPADQPLTGLHWVSNSQALVSTAYDGTVRTAELAPNGAPEKQRFRAHDASVLASAISHEGGVFITVGEDMAVRRWRLPGVEPGLAQARLISPGLTRVWSVLPSPDSRYVVTAGEGDKTFRVNAGIPAEKPALFPASISDVYVTAYSPDGKLLAIGHRNGSLQLWDTSSGKLVGRLAAPAGEQGPDQPSPFAGHVRSVAFTPDSKTLVAVGGTLNSNDPGMAVIYDVPARKIRHRLDGLASFAWSVALNRDGKLAAIAIADGSVRLYETETGKFVRSLEKHTKAARSVAFSPDGKYLASGGFDNAIQLWDTTTWAEKRRFELPNSRSAGITFSPDSSEIVAASRPNVGAPGDSTNCLIYAFRIDGPNAPPRVLQGHTGAVLTVAFLKDGKTLISGGGRQDEFGEVKLWDFATGKVIGEFRGHRSWVETVSVAPDGNSVATGSWAQGNGGELRQWDPRGFRPIAEVKVPDENQYISSGAISRDGKLLVLGGWGRTLTAWDMTDPAKPVLRKQLKEHKAGLRSVAFDPASKRFVSTDESGMVKIWDAESLDLIVSFKASANPIYRAKFTPDGTQIVTVSGNWQAQVQGEMRVWDPKSGIEIGRFPDQQREVWDIVFLNGGKQMAAIHTPNGAPDDATVKIWDFEKKEVVRNLLPPGSFTNGRCLGVSPDGKHLAVGSSSGPVKVFETTSWQEVLNIPDLTNCTFQVDFSRNGNSLLVASGEGAAIAIRLPK